MNQLKAAAADIAKKTALLDKEANDLKQQETQFQCREKGIGQAIQWKQRRIPVAGKQIDRAG